MLLVVTIVLVLTIVQIELT